MPDSHDVNARFTRLETLIDSISAALTKIEAKLNDSGKINWAPIAIGVTIFFTVAGSVATIYNARISTLNTAVEALGDRTLGLEKAAVGTQLKTETLEQRVSQLEKDVDDIQSDHKHSN
jgi:phosphotransferase system IIB component